MTQWQGACSRVCASSRLAEGAGPLGSRLPGLGGLPAAACPRAQLSSAGLVPAGDIPQPEAFCQKRKEDESFLSSREGVFYLVSFHRFPDHRHFAQTSSQISPPPPPSDALSRHTESFRLGRGVAVPFQNTHARAHMHMHARTHRHRHTYAHTETQRHTRTHTRRHTRTRMHARTDTHTHT